jgi:hypothetical protein
MEDRGLPRMLQSAHLPRHAGQWGPGGNLVIQRWVVRGQPAGGRVAQLVILAANGTRCRRARCSVDPHFGMSLNYGGAKSPRRLR